MSYRHIPTTGRALSELLRRILQDIRALERRPDGRPGASHDVPFKLGGYTLDVDSSNGDLTATNDTTGTVTVVASP